MKSSLDFGEFTVPHIWHDPVETEQHELCCVHVVTSRMAASDTRMAGPVTDLNQMSLDSLKMWSMIALNNYLEVRGKSVEGTYEELAAR